MPPKRKRDEDEPVNVIKTQAQAHALERKLRRDLDLDQEFHSKELRARDLSWSDKDKLIEEYTRFIVLKVYLGDYDANKLSPPILVDELWHAHILDTKSYHDMCYNICETRYIHHRPGGSWDGGRQKRLARTLGAYSVMWPGEDTGNWVWEGDGFPRHQERDASLSPQWSPPEYKPQLPTNKKLRIKLTDLYAREQFVNIGRTEHLFRLKSVYADRNGVDSSAVRLQYDGYQITDGQTAEDLDIADGGEIIVSMEQCGC